MGATTSGASGFSANERRKRMTCTNHVAHVLLNAHVSLWFYGDLQNCCDCGKNPLRDVTSPEGAIRGLRARSPGAVHTRPGPGYRCEGRPYSARPRITARATPRVVHTRPDSGFGVRFSSARCLGGRTSFSRAKLLGHRGPCGFGELSSGEFPDVTPNVEL